MGVQGGPAGCQQSCAVRCGPHRHAGLSGKPCVLPAAGVTAPRSQPQDRQDTKAGPPSVSTQLVGRRCPASPSAMPCGPAGDQLLLKKASCGSAAGGAAGGCARCGEGATSRSCSTHSVCTCSTPSRPCEHSVKECIQNHIYLTRKQAYGHHRCQQRCTCNTPPRPCRIIYNVSKALPKANYKLSGAWLSPPQELHLLHAVPPLRPETMSQCEFSHRLASMAVASRGGTGAAPASRRPPHQPDAISTGECLFSTAMDGFIAGFGSTHIECRQGQHAHVCHLLYGAGCPHDPRTGHSTWAILTRPLLPNDRSILGPNPLGGRPSLSMELTGAYWTKVRPKTCIWILAHSRMLDCFRGLGFRVSP